MVSVIIPIYNAEKYLQRTLKCLQNQTFNDFEVILVDDGSVDGTAQICKAFLNNDNRFKYYYQNNDGVSSARNNGMKISAGKYITFIDADDEIPRNYLEELASVIVETNCDIAICDVSIVCNGNEINRFSCEDKELTKINALNLLLTRKCINSGPCAKLFSRRVLDEILFPKLKAYEDILFVLNVFDKCDRIVSTCKTEYIYHQNEDSAMNVFSKVPSNDIVVASETIIEFLRDKKGLDSSCVYITMSHLMQYVQSALNINNESAKAFIKIARYTFRKYNKDILSCSAFPWKEKIIFIMFAFGINYTKGKFSIVR